MYVLSINILDLEKHNKTFKNSNKMIAVYYCSFRGFSGLEKFDQTIM